MKNVIVVGSVNADLVVSVAELPRAGETVTGGTFARHGGGKGANQAVAARRGGAATQMVGRVGDDAFADVLLPFLVAEDVDVAEVSPTAQTAGSCQPSMESATACLAAAICSGVLHPVDMGPP